MKYWVVLLFPTHAGSPLAYERTDLLVEDGALSLYDLDSNGDVTNETWWAPGVWQGVKQVSEPEYQRLVTLGQVAAQ